MSNKLVFIGADATYEEADVCIFGAGMDTTTTNRPGTRFAPNQCRLESYGLETYSPYLDLDLEDYKIYDDGDLELTFGNHQVQLEEIYNKTKEIINDHKVPFMIGGEHLVSLGSIKAVNEKYEDLHIIHFDAHCDLRTDYMNQPYSHSTVMYHVSKLENVSKLYQFGIRSGTKEEFEYAKNNTYMEKFSCSSIEKICDQLKDKNVYISIDLDVLDPSIFPGTGTPEPGGIMFKELLEAIAAFQKLNNIKGIDVVELSPVLDASGVSNAVCAKVIRELLLIVKGDK